MDPVVEDKIEPLELERLMRKVREMSSVRREQLRKHIMRWICIRIERFAFKNRARDFNPR